MDKIFSFLGWIGIFGITLSLQISYGILKIDNFKEKELIIKYEKSPEMYETQYFGYIIFPYSQVERLIMYGDAKEVVKKQRIGIFGEIPENFPDDYLILVGHSRKNQFSILHQLKISDKVKIKRGNREYTYKVEKKEVINASDLSFIKNIKNKMLVLITCMEDNNKRLVIYCQI